MLKNTVGRLASIVGLVFLAACTSGTGGTGSQAGIEFFTAEPSTVVEGESVQLSWKATGASVCYLSSVSAQHELPTFEVSCTGGWQDSPSVDTNYRFDALVGDTYDSELITVRVEPEPAQSASARLVVAIGADDVDLYLADPDAYAPVLLVDTPGYVVKALWNADRTRLLLTDRVADDDNRHRLVDVAQDGTVVSDELLLPDDDPDCCGSASRVYAWHPSEDSFLYKRTEETCGPGPILRRSFGGTETLFLDPAVVGDAVVYDVDFHPNGREVIWTSQVGCWSPTLAIFHAELTGGEIDADTITTLLDDGQHVSPVMYSPDGDRIAFRRSDADQGYGGPENLYVMNADGTGIDKLTDHTTVDERIVEFAWSPDGSSLVYGATSDETGGVFDLYRVAADGASPSRVSDAAMDERVRDW